MEYGKELSKTVATFIIEKMIMDQDGLEYSLLIYKVIEYLY